MSSFIRWFASNLSALILSFVLALVVWISAVTASDPNVELTRTVPIEIVGQEPDTLMVGSIPTQARVTMRAPSSVWDRMSSVENAVRTWIDLTGLGDGSHVVLVQIYINEVFRPVRLISLNPESVTVTLEEVISKDYMVKLEVKGEPTVGYQAGVAARRPSVVTVTGPESLISQVESVGATLDISDADETIRVNLPLRAVNTQGDIVPDVTITPATVEVTQPITLLGGYRNMVVKVVTVGRVAVGYKMTNVSVSPPNVVVFSTDPQLVNNLPSFIETEPLDINGADDDIEALLSLVLPEGVSIVGDDKVLVQVNIAAIEGSITISLPVTVIGLLPTYSAEVSPDTVDVILSGPIPELDAITPTDIRAVVDVNGLELGTHQVEVDVDVLLEGVWVETVLPATVEVTIDLAMTPTPTITFSPTLEVTPTPES
ncbi:MAG: CdaR family protein [Anaerolineales bacterium]|nr:CdaR family protein [Anaerolineales bacterium]